jgi:zinc protease
MHPDRLTPPAFGTIDQVDIAEAKPMTLANGLPVFSIDAGSQELVKIECVFPAAGAWNQPESIISVGTNDMLDEGTQAFSSSSLAETIDFYGAFIQTEATMDFSSVCLFSLNKHLQHTLPLLAEILKHPTFPEEEFKTYIQNKKEKFQVDEAKVSTVARKKFTQLLFGDQHPYGHYLVEQEFQQTSRAKLAAFHAGNYGAQNCHVVVSGKIDPALGGLLDKQLGDNGWKAQAPIFKPVAELIQTDKQKKHFIPKKDAVQSAIRIGRMLFNKTHPDFMGMQVLNTIFGGYFGSRLMANIREDKGYTYGIGSGLVSLKQGGYFFISTEVGVSVCKDALKEIYAELRKMREELIPEDELTLVRNYMLGTFLRSADGAFALADKFKGVYDYKLDYSYYQKFVQTIRTISAPELRALAEKYFREEDMTELVVGMM